jgi:hypothetical protein
VFRAKTLGARFDQESLSKACACEKRCAFGDDGVVADQYAEGSRVLGSRVEKVHR